MVESLRRASIPGIQNTSHQLRRESGLAVRQGRRPLGLPGLACTPPRYTTALRSPARESGSPVGSLPQVTLKCLAHYITDGLSALVGARLGRLPQGLGDADRAHNHRDLSHDSGPRVGRGTARARVVGLAVLAGPVLPAARQSVSERVTFTINLGRVNPPNAEDDVFCGGLKDCLAVVACDVDADECGHAVEYVTRTYERQYVCATRPMRTPPEAERPGGSQ